VVRHQSVCTNGAAVFRASARRGSAPGDQRVSADPRSGAGDGLHGRDHAGARQCGCVPVVEYAAAALDLVDVQVAASVEDLQPAGCPVVVSASSVVPACPVNGPPGLTVQPATAAGELPAPSVKAPAAAATAAKSSRTAWDDATSRVRAWLRPGWRRVNASPDDKTVVPEPTCARRLAGGGGGAVGGDSGGARGVRAARVRAGPVRRTPPAPAATTTTAGQ
jgi:hypothetical protein